MEAFFKVTDTRLPFTPTDAIIREINDVPISRRLLTGEYLQH